MRIKYFLDESGNTGDLTLPTSIQRNQDQPFFVLSCVGIDDEAALAVEVSRLRTKYRIQAPELKFASVRNKPEFLRDLLKFLSDSSSPILIEATDKKFSICIHIIECLIVPAVGPMDFEPMARLMKNVFADLLAENLPQDVIEAFCQACQSQDKASLRDCFQKLEAWCASTVQNDITTGIMMFLKDTKSDFEEVAETDADGLKRFLPVPDSTTKGKPVQILPHVHSLLHIYGRLNRYHGSELDQVILHHDEQLQYDKTLFEGMALAESEVGNDLPQQPSADFRFFEQAELKFISSDSSIGVQVADLLAGMVAFGLREMRTSGAGLSNEWKAAFFDLRKFEALGPGLGVNVVASTMDAHKFHSMSCR